VASSEFWRPI